MLNRYSRALGLLLALLLGGCAAELLPTQASWPELPAESSLWTLALKRGGEPLYTGLLLLNRDETGVGMVLLDPTGIKLLEGQVLTGGGLSGVKALRPVAERGLPDFLGQAVQHLFLETPPPVGASCRTVERGSLCQGLNQAGGLARVRRWGPFVVWRADYSTDNEGAGSKLTGARLGQGWLSPEVALELRPEMPE